MLSLAVDVQLGIFPTDRLNIFAGRAPFLLSTINTGRLSHDGFRAQDFLRMANNAVMYTSNHILFYLFPPC
jgi:hypothetical protein